MKVLFCGDIVGRSGRKVVLENLQDLRKKLDVDFVVVNGENAAHGFGITEKMCNMFYDAGADVITTGNHVWDQREIMNYIGGEPRLLRPMNYPKGAPGVGVGVYQDRKGLTVVVIHLLGRLFMDPLDDPFAAVEGALGKHRLGENADCIIVDMHAEATSEKMSMGHVLDGRVSMVIGTHSHVPTADAQILTGGAAYITDCGMCGDYDSVIGMQKAEAASRFTSKIPGGRLEPATGEATLSAVYVETNDETGAALYIAPLRLGGRLSPCWPI